MALPGVIIKPETFEQHFLSLGKLLLPPIDFAEFKQRPVDAIGNAIMIAKSATGEIEDITTEDGKNAAAVALGRMGGKARAKGMSAKRRKEIAKKAAEKRWKHISRE